MDSTAIQTIQRMALAAVASESALQQVDSPLALVPQDYKLVSLEMYCDAPIAHKETFRTHYIEEFFLYAIENATDKPTVFIDEKSMTAHAIFDRSSQDVPSWQHHKAILDLEFTPALIALLEDNNHQFSQQDLVDFAQDWRDHITFYHGDEPLEFNDAIGRIRRLKITNQKTVESERGDFKANVSAFEQIEIDAAGAPLPSHFTFVTEPYMQFDRRTYTGQLRALGDENKLQLKYRLIGLPAIEQAIAEEFKERIHQQMNAFIFIGTI